MRRDKLVNIPAALFAAGLTIGDATLEGQEPIEPTSHYIVPVNDGVSQWPDSLVSPTQYSVTPSRIELDQYLMLAQQRIESGTYKDFIEAKSLLERIADAPPAMRPHQHHMDQAMEYGLDGITRLMNGMTCHKAQPCPLQVEMKKIQCYYANGGKTEIIYLNNQESEESPNQKQEEEYDPYLRLIGYEEPYQFLG